MIDAYAKLLARCGTVNQINQVHITFANRMTPLELHELLRGVAPGSPVWGSTGARPTSRPQAIVAETVQRTRADARFPPESREWVENLADWASRSGKAVPEPYVRRRVGPNVVSYSNGGPSRAKSLLLCFTGRGPRMFIPTCVLLQHLSAERHDLVVASDPSRQSFRGGLAGMAPDFPSFVDAVGGLFDRRAYGSVVALGASGGGLPAIVVALRYGLDKAISLSGQSPHDPRWQLVTPGGADAMLRAAVRNATAPPNLLLVHSAAHQVDADAARDLAAVVPARVVSVHGHEGQKLGHNSMMPLLRHRRLAAFLASALDPEVAGFVRGHGSTPVRIEL